VALQLAEENFSAATLPARPLAHESRFHPLPMAPFVEENFLHPTLLERQLMQEPASCAPATCEAVEKNPSYAAPPAQLAVLIFSVSDRWNK